VDISALTLLRCHPQIHLTCHVEHVRALGGIALLGCDARELAKDTA